jgi:hypothetical protein
MPIHSAGVNLLVSQLFSELAGAKWSASNGNKF